MVRRRKGLVLGVYSAKGGVGKTTTVANVGTALASFGKKVLVVDGNFFTPNLGYHFGIFNSSPGVQEVLEERVGLEEAIVPHPSGVDVLPSSIPPRRGFKGGAWKRMVSSARYDLSLIHI